MPSRALLLLGLLVVSISVAAAATQAAPSTDADRWDLTELYATDAAWDADAQKVEGQLAGLAGCRGHLGEDAAALRRCLELQADITKRYFRLTPHASQRFDEDTGVAASLERRQRARVLGTRFSEAAAFVDPKLLALGRARIDALVGADPGLRIYAHELDNTPCKDSGGYMNGYAYDVHPYLLINYNDDYESLTTLAHEWGHAMHSVLSNGAQPFVSAGYATFVAEIASTLDEALLLDYMLAHARDDDERLLYLGTALEGLRTTFFRQAMFAEFEREVHARVDAGQALSGETFSRIYGDIERRYYGDSVQIDDAYAVERAYIPHFYNAFYVYQYATSITASSLFAQRIEAGEPGARERYLDLLRAGGSDYPYELVKRAGVDLAQPAPYQALAARMNGIMDRMEAILAERR